jgi:hypothetical protein
MVERSRFRIMDLVVAVAAAGVGFGGNAYIEASADRSGISAAAFWMIGSEYAAVAYYVTRFVRGRSARLLVLAVALGFAAAAVGLYLSYNGLDVETIAPVGGLMAIACVLAVGGVAHGLIDHWQALREPPPDAQTETPLHPLDRELLP